MKRIQRVPKTLQPVVLAGVLLAGTLGMVVTAAAQDVSDLQTPKGSLVLKAQGSFFVGGENVEQTETQIGFWTGPGHVTVNQMYVEYMIPQGGGNKVPVVMVHGGTLSGKSFETTPDGRMGWDEYFVRKGHACYNADQVSRARSGFDPGCLSTKFVRGTFHLPRCPTSFGTATSSVGKYFRFGPTFGVALARRAVSCRGRGRVFEARHPRPKRELPDPQPQLQSPVRSSHQVERCCAYGSLSVLRLSIESDPDQFNRD